MKAIKVSDLKDQLGTPFPRPMLKCMTCGNEYSAHRGDYWAASPGYIFKCCRRNMALVTKQTVFVSA